MTPDKPRRIPTLIALFVLGIVSIAGFYSADVMPLLLGRAKTQTGVEPKNIQITNSTDNMFTILWTTDTHVSGTVHYSTDQVQNTATAYDIRDTDDIAKAYKTHYIELKGLVPESLVSFRIDSGGGQYPQKPVRLPAPIPSPPQSLPLSGLIQTAEGNPTSGAVVIVQLEKAQPWSFFVTNSTQWIIPLSHIRTSDQTDYYCRSTTCDENLAVTLLVFAEEGETSIQTTLVDSRPLPTPLLIGQVSQNLTVPTSEVTSTPAVATIAPSITLSPSQAVFGITTKRLPTRIPMNTPKLTATPTVPPIKTTKLYPISILTPQESANLSFPKPLIRGQGVPGEEVQITLESEVKQIGKTTVGKDGTWMWTPQFPLAPGNHTVTIKTKDGRGKTAVVTRTFHTLKSGEQVLSDSTPSATLIPTAAVAPIPTPTPEIIVITPMPKTGAFVPSLFFIGGGASLLLLALTLL